MLGTIVNTACIVDPVLSALQGDNTFLYTNSTLDLVTSTVFATTYGIGMILAVVNYLKINWTKEARLRRQTFHSCPPGYCSQTTPL